MYDYNNLNEIEKAVISSVAQITQIFKPTKEQLFLFKSYLEDILLYEIISCKTNCVKIGIDDGNISDNLRIALIASGISSNGNLPKDITYNNSNIHVNINTHLHAKRMSRILENERLRSMYSQRVSDAIYNCNKFKNMYELVELGIAGIERECGYIESLDTSDDFYFGAYLGLWEIERENLEKMGLENSLAYDICSYVNDLDDGNRGFRHYPLATNVALCRMADIDFSIATTGDFNNKEGLIDTLRNIEAAKITDKELIEPFEKRFLEIVKPYAKKMGVSLPKIKTNSLKKHLTNISKYFV